MKKKKIPVRMLRLLIIVFVALIGAAVTTNYTATSVMALPKIYQDKINEAQKKKKEKKDKEKKEEEEKKKKEEEEKEQKGDSGKPSTDEGTERYMLPIIPKADLEPEIRIMNVSFLRNGSNESTFEPGDYVDLKVEFRISSYEGFNDINITCNARDDRNHQIGHDSRSMPIQIDRNITEVFRNLVDTRSINYTGKIYADIEVEVQNTRIGRTIQGRITGGEHYRRGGVHIIDSYLATDESYLFSYPGYPAHSFNAGDSYWIVVEYEIDKTSDEDVKFEYEFTTGYDYYVDSGRFWDRPRNGIQRIYRKGWFPYYIPGSIGSNGWVTFHLKASYAGDSDIISSHYDVYEKGHDYSNDAYSNDTASRGKAVLTLGPVYFTRSSQDSTYTYYFDISEDIYTIVKYDYNRWNQGYFQTGTINYVVYDASEGEILSGDTKFTPQNQESRRFKIAGPGELGIGRYRFDITMRIGSLAQTHRSFFYVQNQKVIKDPTKKPQDSVGAEKNPIEYQIDENLVLSLPPEWYGKLSTNPSMPPLVFHPNVEILGMVSFYDYPNVSITMEDAIKKYEEKERESTGIGEFRESSDKKVGENIALIRFYDGKIVTKGQYPEDKVDKIVVGALYLLHVEGESSRLYVVRLVGPESGYENLKKILDSMNEKITIEEKTEISV